MIEVYITNLLPWTRAANLEPGGESSTLFAVQYGKEVEKLFDALPREEVEKACSYRFVKDSLMFMVGRFLARQAFSERFSGVAPRAWRFEISGHGKPYLAEQAAWFNISHSWPYVAVVIDDVLRCGIDIETHNHIISWKEMADFTFHVREREALERAENPQELFWSLWTLKEALVKALGYGMRFPFDDFSVDVHRLTAWRSGRALPFALWHEPAFLQGASLSVARAKSDALSAPFRVNEIDLSALALQKSLRAGEISSKEMML